MPALSTRIRPGEAFAGRAEAYAAVVAQLRERHAQVIAGGGEQIGRAHV